MGFGFRGLGTHGFWVMGSPQKRKFSLGRLRGCGGREWSYGASRSEEVMSHLKSLTIAVMHARVACVAETMGFGF